jgi:HPt (histidine-containing phosphotransfer) domain-containing protein
MSDAADPARISQLAEGVPGGVKGLVELFITHTSESMRQLRAAADESRAPDVHLHAHRGAGTAGALGAAQLADLFRKLEASARQPGMPDVRALVAEVEQELMRVHVFLSTLISDDRR